MIDFYNKPIHSFSYSILFGSIAHNCLLLDTFLLAKIDELILNALSTIVRPEDLNFPPCMIFDQSFELLEYFEGFILMLQIEYPCFPGEVIDKDNIIEVATKGVHKHGFTKVRVDEL